MPRYLRLGVPERVRWNGDVATPLDEAAVAQALTALEQEGVEAWPSVCCSPTSIPATNSVSPS